MTDLVAVLERFTNPNAHDFIQWRGRVVDGDSVVNDIRRVLDNARLDVSGARSWLDRGLRACSTQLEQRLQLDPNWGAQPGVAVRLARNLRGLFATARIALEAAQGRQKDLDVAIEEAYAIWPAAGAWSGQHRLNLYGPDVATHTVRAFAKFDEQGIAILTPLVWTMFWLREDERLLVATPESPDPWLEIAVPHSVQNAGHGGVGHIGLGRLLNCKRPQLVTHPSSALSLIDRGFEGVLEEMWTAAAPTRSVIWKLIGGQNTAHYGGSLSLAVRVGLQALTSEHPRIRRSCVLIGGVEGERLCSVEQVAEKLRAAAAYGCRSAVVAIGKRCKSSEEVDRLSNDLVAELRLRGMDQIKQTSSLREAIAFAHGVNDSSIGVPGALLRGRYRLVTQISDRDDLWIAHDELWATRERPWDESRPTGCVIRLYPYGSDDNGIEDFRRSAWSRDLRTLSRLANCPGAADSLLTLRQAFKDPAKQCFVLAMESAAGDVTPLSRFLDWQKRRRTEWLAENARPELWSGLRRIAEGLQLVHSERILHGNVSADAVFCTNDGPASFRLGGLDQALRIASVGDRPETRRSSWCRPPDETDAGLPPVYGIGTDWYGFGMLAARLLLPVEDLDGAPSADLHLEIDRRLLQDRSLSEPERDLVRGLIAGRGARRIIAGDQVLFLIDEIRRVYRQPRRDASIPTVGAVLHEKDLDRLALSAARAGFVADPVGKFDLRNDAHCELLRQWIAADLREGTLFKYYAEVPGEPAAVGRYGIFGRSKVVIYGLWSWAKETEPDAWKLAKLTCRDNAPRDLRPELCVPIASLNVRVYREHDVLIRSRSLNHRRWSEVLPHERALNDEERGWESFQQFLRVTNQIELLMLRDEIFRYSYESSAYVRDQREERLSLIDVPQDRRPWSATRSLFEFLRAELESGRGTGKVHLLKRGPFEVCDDEPWDVTFEDGKLVLRRINGGAIPSPQGFIRASDYRGKIKLIERRQDAIERLGRYGYLMRALLTPRKVCMNTGAASVSLEKVFGGASKIESFHDKPDRLSEILQSIPIYALEGPPGTGKSTLTAHLVRAVLMDDPSQQVLITAQAHGAVDVLRQQVERLTSDLAPPGGAPIAVRLGRKSADNTTDVDALEETLRLHIGNVVSSFEATPPTSKAAAAWRETARHLLRRAPSNSSSALSESLAVELGEAAPDVAANYRELIRSSANIVYATTSARDLGYLAQSRPTFDWVIIEEAGKAHGFDLALPMQTGHRWVLLGDSDQLRPHRFDDFNRALACLPQVSDELKALREGNRAVVDDSWLAWWESLSLRDRQSFSQDSKVWLPTFLFLSMQLSGVEDETGKRPSGRLGVQFRMHPEIGTLIGEVFYPNRLANAKECASIRHQVQLPGIPREQIQDRAIVWVDCAWCGQPPRSPGENGIVPYSNEQEVARVIALVTGLQSTNPAVRQTLAVLSPYSRQVRALQHSLKGVTLKPGFEFKQSLARRQSELGEVRAHTVDSFQGNEADIVIISLVRNNSAPSPLGLGFVKDPSRLNVLASRAAKLLVLVGSWEFFDRQVRYSALEEVEKLKDFMLKLDAYRADGRLIFVPAAVKVGWR